MVKHRGAEPGIPNRIQNRGDVDPIAVHDAGRPGFVIDARIVHTGEGGNDVADSC